MLILTRRIDETIVIGSDTRISVLGVKGNRVRLGIEAPASVSVHREEVFDQIHASGLGQDFNNEPKAKHEHRR